MTQGVDDPVTIHALSGSDLGPHPTQWTCESADEVTVWLKTATGESFVLLDSSSYTVTGSEPLINGLSVELAADLLDDEWAEGAAMALVRGTPLDQTTGLTFSQGFTPEVVEAILNRIVRQVQDVQAPMERTLRAPLGETLEPLADAETRALGVLAFDSDGQPDPSKTYAQLVTDVAAELPILDEIAAAGAEQIENITFAGQAASAALLAARDEGLDDIADAVSTGAAALGLPTGGIIDIIPASEGYEEGWCFCDANGWTAPAYYTHPTGVVGKVVRFIIPEADFSGLSGAIQIHVAPPIMDADYSIVFIVGQSDASGQDAVPMPVRTPRPFTAMLDTAKPTAWVGAFGSAFADAVGSEYIFGTTNHQGTTLPLAIGDQLERLIEDRDGEVFGVDHNRKVLIVQVGLSSADVDAFNYPSAHFTRVIDWATKVQAIVSAGGLTAKVKAIVWGGWGAYAYQNGYSQATVESKIESYSGASGSIATYILPIFGQTGEVIPVGFCGDAHHFQGSDPITPQVALAERALCLAQPGRYGYILNKNNYHLNGGNLGWGGSTSHQHPDEEEDMSGPIADWLHCTITRDGATWLNLVPEASWFSRPAADELLMTVPNWPAGANFGFRPSGLTTSYGAQDCHGWFVCDPATPTVPIAQVVSPFQWGAPGTLKFKGASAFPVPCEVRFACMTSSNSLGGNTVVKFDSPDTVRVRGVEKEVVRTLPTLKLQVA